MFESLFDYFSPTKRLLKALQEGAKIKKIDALLKNPLIPSDFYRSLSSSGLEYSLLTIALDTDNGKIKKSRDWQEHVQKALLAKGVSPKQDNYTLSLALREDCVTDELLSHYDSLTGQELFFDSLISQDSFRYSDAPILTAYLFSPYFRKETAQRLIKNDPKILSERYTLFNNNLNPLEVYLFAGGSEEDNLADILDLFSNEEVTQAYAFLRKSSYEPFYDPNLVQTFLEHGLNVFTKDSRGTNFFYQTLEARFQRTILDEMEDFDKLFDYLKTTALDPNEVDKDGETALTRLLSLEPYSRDYSFDHTIKEDLPIEEAFKLINETNVDVTIKNNKGQNALHCFVSNPYLSCLSPLRLLEASRLICTLVAKGCDPYEADNQGMIPAVHLWKNISISYKIKNEILDYFASQKKQEKQSNEPFCVARAKAPQTNSKDSVKERGTQG